MAVDLLVYTARFSTVVVWKLESLLVNVNLLSHVVLVVMLQ